MKSGGYRGPKTPGAIYKHRRYWIGYESPDGRIFIYTDLGEFKTFERALAKAEMTGFAGTSNTVFEDYQVWLYGKWIGTTPYTPVRRVRVKA